MKFGGERVSILGQAGRTLSGLASPWLLTLPLLFAGCAQPVQAKQPALPEAVSPSVPSDTTDPPPALTEDEKTIAEGLRRNATKLFADLGERSPQTPWQLLESADYLDQQLSALGFEPDRQGYELGELAVFNLSVTIPGGREAGQILVVGAHYDSSPNDRGVGGAIAAAALLELARMMKGAKLERTLQLVLFAAGAPPHGSGEGRGALRFAQRLRKQNAEGPPSGTPEVLRPSYEKEALGMVDLRELAGLRGCSEKQDPTAVLSLSKTPGSNHLSRELDAALFGAPLKIERGPEPSSDSDAGAFFAQGIPAVSVGTARNCSGLVEMSNQDFQDAARVVSRIRSGIGQILREKPQNDGIVTLASPASR